MPSLDQPDARRFEALPVGAATYAMAEGLFSMWSHKTVDAAHETLSHPTILVTNQRDKELQLAKLKTLSREISRLMGGRKHSTLQDMGASFVSSVSRISREVSHHARERSSARRTASSAGQKGSAHSSAKPRAEPHSQLATLEA